jgi:hypothetical protein
MVRCRVLWEDMRQAEYVRAPSHALPGGQRTDRLNHIEVLSYVVPKGAATAAVAGASAPPSTALIVAAADGGGEGEGDGEEDEEEDDNPKKGRKKRKVFAVCVWGCCAGLCADTWCGRVRRVIRWQ